MKNLLITIIMFYSSIMVAQNSTLIKVFDSIKKMQLNYFTPNSYSATNVKDFNFSTFKALPTGSSNQNFSYIYSKEKILLLEGMKNSMGIEYKLNYLGEVENFIVYIIKYDYNKTDFYRHGFILHDVVRQETFYVSFLQFFENEVVVNPLVDYFSIYMMDENLFPIYSTSFYGGKLVDVSTLKMREDDYFKTIYYHGKNDKRKIDMKIGDYTSSMLLESAFALIKKDENLNHMCFKIEYSPTIFGLYLE